VSLFHINRARIIIATISSLVMLSSPIVALANINVSPPNWWAEMNGPYVELMLHGKGIADDKVTLLNIVDKRHNRLVEYQRLASDNYLFVTLNLASAKPGNIGIVLTDADGSTQTVTYEIRGRRSKGQKGKGFSAKDAIYLIAPDRFANGNDANDSVEGYLDTHARDNKGGRHGGDIQGIINHLDYIADMGFTQIWSMPMLENAMPDYSYHGYSITDYYKIDPRYGTNAQFVELSNKAADKGVGMIMDMVLNHIGSHHPWMADMPSKDWINNDGVFVGTTHKREALHDPHAVQSDIEGFSTGWFVPTMPDLNQTNPHLSNYLIQNAIWWVEFANLSGIRVDTYSYSDKGFLSEWTSRLMDEYPALNIVGEEWSVNPAITAYWQAESYRFDDYQSALPSVMDFPLQEAVGRALKSDESWNAGLITLYQMLATDFLYGDPNNLVVFADNHDMSRVYSQVNENIDQWNMMMTFFLTSRGIPQVFYGTEILMTNPDTEDHGIIRGDFPGGWKGDQVNGFTGEGLNNIELWSQSRIKQLLSLRKLYPSLFEGRFTHYAPKEGIYTYFRHTDDVEARIMVVLNKNSTASSVDLVRYSALIEDRKKLTRLADEKQFAINEAIVLAPMSATVFIVK